MDPGDLIYLAFFALWLYSQIAAAAKKNKQRQQERAAPKPPPRTTAPPPPPRVPPRQEAPQQAQPSRGEGLLASLSELEREIETSLGELDEKVRAQVAFIVDNDYGVKADALRRDLRDDTSPQFDRARHETEWLMSHYRGLLQTARVHSDLRQRRGLGEANVIADGLAAELDRPRNVSKPLPPPVALVWDVGASDRMRESALADATLFVPRTVVEDPSHWSLIAPEIARYLNASAPALYQNIYEGLDLGASEARVGSDPRALTRVLFASWIGRIVADAAGALFFGPSYLQSIAQLYAQPGAPARVTSIVLNEDGSVHNEPPAHVRVHVTARWLTRMGYASEATAVRREWDEAHGSPEVLGFWGSMTSLPAAPVLAAASELTDELYQLPLDALGGARLAHVPGLAGWENHARAAGAARASLAAGERTSGSARGLVAGAIEAALAEPGDNQTIHQALYESLSAPVRPREAALPERRPPSVAAASPLKSLDGRDVAEALILGELLLERPGFARASAGKRPRG